MAEPLGVLETVGKVAGVGGLALVVMMFVFRDMIRRRIFPMLAPAQAYRLLRLIVVCVSTISLAGLAAWAWTEVKKNGPDTEEVVFPSESPQPAMAAHLKLIDAGKFEDAWNGLATRAHKTMSKDQALSAFESVRPPLGAVVDRKLRGTQNYTKLPNGLEGAFSGATYVTKFANGTSQIEVLYTVAESGRWKVMYHTINPCVASIC